jgi:hypothetical protein
MAGQPGFFDVDERHAALSAAGDALERLAAVLDFEMFEWESTNIHPGPPRRGVVSRGWWKLAEAG